MGIDEKFIESSYSKNEKKPDWGKSTPHNAYEDTPFLARPVIGYEERSVSLSNDSVLHPSLLESPDTKGLLSLTQLKKKRAGWNPQDNVCKLTKFEEQCKDFWYDVRDLLKRFIA